MVNHSIRKLDQFDTASTARLDRRQTVLARLEAALLAEKLSVTKFSEESTGTDPYNTARIRTAWNKQAQ